MTTEGSGADPAFDGVEWLVDAHGCSPSELRNVSRLEQLFQRIVAEMALSPIGFPTWTQFPDTGGVTGFLLLQESHLACHTFPEYGTICLNLFCCRPRAQSVDAGWFTQLLAATSVSIRCFSRPIRPTPAVSRPPRQSDSHGAAASEPGGTATQRVAPSSR